MLSLNYSSLQSLTECKFNKCKMESSSFSDMKIPYSKFNGCDLRNSKFQSCVLANSSFSHSDLYEVHFESCNLEYVDFSSAKNYQINISMNVLKGSKHDAMSALGLLRGSGVVIN